MKRQNALFILCVYLVPLIDFACDIPINIRSGSNAPLSKIIEEIATQCHLNVIYLQENTKTMLDNKKHLFILQTNLLKMSLIVLL